MGGGGGGVVPGCVAATCKAYFRDASAQTINHTCCHTETNFADQTSYLTQSQNIDTRQTSPNTVPTTPGVWQGGHKGTNV